jgi:hypothetical protein
MGRVNSSLRQTVSYRSLPSVVPLVFAVSLKGERMIDTLILWDIYCKTTLLS